MVRVYSLHIATLLTFFTVASGNAKDIESLPQPPVGIATDATVVAQKAVFDSLPLADQTDFENAKRGLIAQIEDPQILNPDGSVAWDIRWYDFIKENAPSTANPSLWRQGQLNSYHGLFKVTEGIWQFRGYDLAVMTIIKGKTGWIVVDPLTTPATAAAGLKLANKYLGERPVSAVIYTHSHLDHFGGARGVVSENDIKERGVEVIAPHGFMAEAVSENLLAGVYMNRRVVFHVGSHLPFDGAGHIGTGLGQRLAAGSISLIAPTKEISPNGELLEIDGIDFEFLDASDTEAPSELVFYLPQFRALGGAEVVTRTFHNALTPRGAKVRDVLRWSKVIDDMLVEYGAKSDVLFASHHWPTWGVDNVERTLLYQRDLYRYLHDQTLRLANHGETMHEIAEELDEPSFPTVDFGVRDYYGTMNHNSKAVYQHYFGWWDGVPANYHPLPPVEQAKRYVEFMGGETETLRKAINAFNAGDYRWAATVFNNVVFGNPDNQPARSWLAASYEQIGFQTESGAWRNYYLTAAMELRKDTARDSQGASSSNLEFMPAVPTLLLFDSLAVRFNPKNFKHEPAVIEFVFPDRNETVHVDITQAVAFPRVGANKQATTIVEMNRSVLDLIAANQTTIEDLLKAEKIKIVSGKADLVKTFFGALDRFSGDFNVVTP